MRGASILVFPVRPAAHACDSYQGAWGSKFCARCCWHRSAHRRPRFAEVSCSQCGETFGAGDHGFSACDEHEEIG